MKEDIPPRPPMTKAQRKYLRYQLKQVASEGGKARWKDVTPEERTRILSEASKKGVEAKRKKKLEREKKQD